MLTQFHFSYCWLVHCRLPLEAKAEYDMAGIDALVNVGEETVALQVKKETYRSEARIRRRFAPQGKKVTLIVEVPYTITTAEKWCQKQESARKSEVKEQASLFLHLAEKFQRWLPNNFVVFSSNYCRFIEHLLKDAIAKGHTGTIGWRLTLERAVEWSESTSP